MQVVNYSVLRKNLKSVLDKTIADNEAVIVSRSQIDDIVMLPLKEYNALIETLYLLRSEPNRTRLLNSVARIEKGIFENHGLIEE